MNHNFGRFIAVAGMIMLVLALAIPASAQDSTTAPMNTLTVTGSGTAYAAPDVAYVELGVQTTDPDLATAFSQTGQKISAVLDALQGLGIDAKNIQTSGVNVNPQDQYDPQTGKSTGKQVYQVSNTVQVTVLDVTKVESVLTSAIGAGANTIYNLNFGIQDSSALEQQARAQAVANAQDRANQLATALNVTLGAPVIVTETPQSSSQPLPAVRGVAMATSQSSQPVSSGQISVTVAVQVTFGIS